MRPHRGASGPGLLSARPRALPTQHHGEASSRRRKAPGTGGSSRWRGPPRGRSTTPERLWLQDFRPRPLGRLGSSRLPAVHLPPINPVICRGSYLLRVGMLVLGRDSRLDAFSGSPVRTWLPSDAAPATTGTPAVRPPRSSRTRGSPPQHPIRPWRIETELSHDVLNPARVPLSWANSPTLGTFSGPRMRRADIEVPNPAVDVDSWAGSACYPRGSFYPLSHGPSTRHRGITRPDFRPCSACPPRSQAPVLPLRAPADCHPA
jgi:hypothetical protein